MSRVVQALPPHAFTLSGKTHGPAVPLGRNRYAKSQMMFMHEDELLRANRDMGWPNPAEHAKVVAELDAAKSALAEAQAANAALADKAATLEKTILLLPPAPKPSAVKSTAKKKGASDGE